MKTSKVRYIRYLKVGYSKTEICRNYLEIKAIKQPNVPIH